MEDEPLLPPGNALRPRSLGYFALGSAALVLLMCHDGHWALSVPVGLVAVLLAAFGALDFAGTFDDATEPGAASASLRSLGPRLLEVLGVGLAWLVCLRLAVAGSLSGHAWTAPLLVTGTSLGAVVSLGRLALELGARAAPLRSRPGFWLLLLGVALYVPWLGSYSLLDPWEPHYGEVAREMLARNDWLSLWWAQDGWFWSKPALDFWIQGLFFAALGVDFRPDGMLAARALGYLPQPEWAARMPVVLLSLVAVFAFYLLVAKAAGKRAGFLAGLSLLCMPYWALLAHQSMTDMPYVAPLTAALSLFGLALLADPEQRVTPLELTVGRRTLRVSAFHLLFGLVLATALPQLAYLLSRHVTLQIAAPPYGFRWHLDELFSGSGLGNCGLPGNEACRGAQPANAMFQPALGALMFGAALGYLLHLNRGERRLKRLLYLGAWYFTALAALGKGAPGLVLPLVVAGAVLFARRDWAELTRVELGGLGLLFAAVCLPWYVQAYMRHGAEFTDRLIFHDMYDRAFVHVHDTNASTDVSFGYYLWQLGYGLFPWTGLALLGLGLLLGRSDLESPARRDLGLLAVLWLTIGLGLFTLSLTKFHHYALPCAPPCAVAIGLVLDRALGNLPGGQRWLPYVTALGSATLLLIYGALRLQPGSLLGTVLENGALPGSSLLEAALSLGSGLGLAVVATRRWGPKLATAERDPALGLLWLSGALVTLLVTRDLSTSLAGDVPASARLLHLITYNYKRSWPASLDYQAINWAFGAVATAAALLMLVARWRSHLVVISCTLGVWFCAFTLWIYLPRLAPHYGQRDVFLAYYGARRGPSEPIIAYQMNWKGENFYSGNRLPAFVSSGEKFKTWLKRLRKAGTRVAFFVTEHGRVGTLKTELGPGMRSTTLTDKRLNNKFALVKVELSGEPD